MIKEFAGDTADVVWRDAAEALLGDEEVLRQDSRLGRTREYLHAAFSINDPRQRWVYSRTPSMNPAFGIAEVIWILLGKNDAGFINYWNPRLPKFAGNGLTYHGAYGYRLRRHFGIDQIARAISILRAAPNSRQVVLQIWDGRYDMPEEDGTPRDSDIPCNVGSMLKVRRGRLDWLQVLRSNDLFLGTPHNFVQFTSLQEIIAGCLGVEIGSYIQLSDSLHVYEEDMSTFSFSDVGVHVENNDSLGLPGPQLVEVLAAMEPAMDLLVSKDLTRHAFAQLVERNILPIGWRNMLCVLAADAARRRNWTQEQGLAIGKCTNPALLHAWAGWSARKRLCADTGEREN